ncbi:MAG: redoxin domain-containing protein [Caldilineaceae bacterium]
MQRLPTKLLALLLAVVAATASCTMPAPTTQPASHTSTQTMTQKSAQMAHNGMKGNGALTPEQTQLLASLPSQGAAPELNNQVWLNSKPLKLADLHGKVVMVEFWTFACINCQHVTPALNALYTKYADKGFVIIGVHSPEFAYEKELKNVKAAIAEAGIQYPVTIDNDYNTWNAYGNHYWPARYLVDKAGNIRLLQIGEGGYAQTDATVAALLAEATPS